MGRHGSARFLNLRVLLLLALAAGAVLTGYYGVRTVKSAARVALRGFDAQRPDVEAIRGWMTVPYIAKTFGLSAEDLYEGLGVPDEGAGGKSLQALNKAYFPGRKGVLIERMKTLIKNAPGGQGPQRRDER